MKGDNELAEDHRHVKPLSRSLRHGRAIPAVTCGASVVLVGPGGCSLLQAPTGLRNGSRALLDELGGQVFTGNLVHALVGLSTVLVAQNRAGRKAFYRVADPRVVDLVLAARALAADNVAALACCLRIDADDSGRNAAPSIESAW